MFQYLNRQYYIWRWDAWRCIRAIITEAGITDKVWDELIADHTGSEGAAGKVIDGMDKNTKLIPALL